MRNLILQARNLDHCFHMKEGRQVDHHLQTLETLIRRCDVSFMITPVYEYHINTKYLIHTKLTLYVCVFSTYVQLYVCVFLRPNVAQLVQEKGHYRGLNLARQVAHVVQMTVGMHIFRSACTR